MALRSELSGSGIVVSTVHPGGVATSIAERARIASAVGAEERERHRKLWTRMLRMPPEAAASIIVRGIERRKARIIVGRDAWFAALAERIAPTGYGKLLKAFTPR